MEGGPERSALFFSKKEKKSIHLRLFGIYYEHLANEYEAQNISGGTS